MRTNVKITVPPAAEPISLALAKAHLKITDEDAQDDAYIQSKIAAAREQLERELDRSFVTRTMEVSLDHFPGHRPRHAPEDMFALGDESFYSFGPVSAYDTFDLRARHEHREIELPYPPLQEVTSVKYLPAGGDGAQLQTLDPAVYAVDTRSLVGRIVLKPGQRWPDTYDVPNAVIITCTAGYGLPGNDGIWAAGVFPAPLIQAHLILLEHFYNNRDLISTESVSRIPYSVEEILSKYRTDWI